MTPSTLSTPWSPRLDTLMLGWLSSDPRSRPPRARRVRSRINAITCEMSRVSAAVRTGTNRPPLRREKDEPEADILGWAEPAVDPAPVELRHLARGSCGGWLGLSLLILVWG